MYINPGVNNSFNWYNDFPCQYTLPLRSDLRESECPVELVVYTNSSGLDAGATYRAYEDVIHEANTSTAGDNKTFYYAAGLLGSRENDTILV